MRNHISMKNEMIKYMFDDKNHPQAGGSLHAERRSGREPPLLSASRWLAPGDWRRWSGEIRADWPHVDVGRLRRHIDLPFDLMEGRGQLGSRLTVQEGGLAQAGLDLRLEAVALRLAQALPPLTLHRIAGRLELERAARTAAASAPAACPSSSRPTARAARPRTGPTPI